MPGFGGGGAAAGIPARLSASTIFSASWNMSIAAIRTCGPYLATIASTKFPT
jgi:hypothetical protein